MWFKQHWVMSIFLGLAALSGVSTIVKSAKGES